MMKMHLSIYPAGGSNHTSKNYTPEQEKAILKELFTNPYRYISPLYSIKGYISDEQILLLISKSTGIPKEHVEQYIYSLDEEKSRTLLGRMRHALTGVTYPRKTPTPVKNRRKLSQKPIKGIEREKQVKKEQLPDELKEDWANPEEARQYLKFEEKTRSSAAKNFVFNAEKMIKTFEENAVRGGIFGQTMRCFPILNKFAPNYTTEDLKKWLAVEKNPVRKAYYGFELGFMSFQKGALDALIGTVALWRIPQTILSIPKLPKIAEEFGSWVKREPLEAIPYTAGQISGAYAIGKLTQSIVEKPHIPREYELIPEEVEVKYQTQLLETKGKQLRQATTLSKTYRGRIKQLKRPAEFQSEVNIKGIQRKNIRILQTEMYEQGFSSKSIIKRVGEEANAYFQISRLTSPYKGEYKFGIAKLRNILPEKLKPVKRGGMENIFKNIDLDINAKGNLATLTKKLNVSKGIKTSLIITAKPKLGIANMLKYTSFPLIGSIPTFSITKPTRKIKSNTIFLPKYALNRKILIDASRISSSKILNNLIFPPQKSLIENKTSLLSITRKYSKKSFKIKVTVPTKSKPTKAMLSIKVKGVHYITNLPTIKLNLPRPPYNPVKKGNNILKFIGVSKGRRGISGKRKRSINYEVRLWRLVNSILGGVK